MSPSRRGLSRVDELRREAARHRAAASARVPRRPTGEAPQVAVTIPLCGPYDAVPLARLAGMLALLRARARQLGHHRAARRGRLGLWAARHAAAT